MWSLSNIFPVIALNISQNNQLCRSEQCKNAVFHVALALFFLIKHAIFVLRISYLARRAFFARKRLARTRGGSIVMSVSYSMRLFWVIFAELRLLKSINVIQNFSIEKKKIAHCFPSG